LLRLVAAGHTNGQIARRLGVSEGTVRIHLQNIYGRLQVSSRTAAVTRAFPDIAAV
jgi:DNA-binding NarL/FixJ family response regulator